LLGAEAALGTIASSASVTAMYRYGRQLEQNFATALLVTSRATNPVATQSGWYLFAGVSASYLANQIFLDGNTFDNDGQEAMNYDNDRVGVTLGLASSWQNFSLTFAVSDLNLDSDDGAGEDYFQFGTLTFAWRHD